MKKSQLHTLDRNVKVPPLLIIKLLKLLKIDGLFLRTSDREAFVTSP
jgi:hypothetical protein